MSACRKLCRRRQRGAVLLEFALAAPILLLLVFAALEFGLLCWVRLTMQHAVQEGAHGDRATLLARVSEQSMGLYERLQAQPSLLPAPGGHALLRIDCVWPVSTPLLAPLFPDGYRFSVAAALRDGAGT